jgi:hypothetical protein
MPMLDSVTTTYNEFKLLSAGEDKAVAGIVDEA